MAGPWDAYATAPAAPAPTTGPWTVYSGPQQPRTANGVWEAIQAGWQGSVPGLVDRGKLPDIVLDPHNAKWYERAAAGLSQVINETPEMIVGAIGGGAAGGALAGPVGVVAGTGAGAFAVPGAIRTALVERYKMGEIVTSGQFLDLTGIVIKQTAKEAVIGAATTLAGMGAARVVGSAIAPAIGTSMSVETATKVIGATSTGAEITGMVVAPAALDGRLPQWQDFLDAAIVVGGLKASIGVANKIGDIYAKTGIPPEQVVALAKQDAKLAEQLKMETPELPERFQAEALADNARNAILLPDQARAFVEKPFAEVPQAPGTPKVKLNVNYDYINSPAEAKAALARASEVYGPQIEAQTRGTVSWAQTEAAARQELAAMVEAKDTRLLDVREPGTAANASELVMRKALLEGAVEDFTTRARAYDAAKSTPLEAVQMMAAAERVAMLSAQFQGAASEAGRALNILKDIRAAEKMGDEVTKLLQMHSKDPAAIAAIMKEVDNPVAAAKAARTVVESTTWEKMAEGLKAVMLSGPITWGANIVGNATFLPLRPVIDAVAVPFGLARQVLSGAKTERVRAVEPVARIAGNWQGAVDAFMAAGSFIRMHASQPMEGLRQLDQMGAKKVEVQKRAIPGDLGVIVRSPFLALSVPDKLFRMMIERGEANAIAARRAAAEGHNPLSREFREKMAEYRQNLTPEQMKQIESIGDRGTFNADLGKFGQSLQSVVREAGPLGFLVAPFVRTPLNLMKETLRLSPAAPFIDTWRADIAAGGARAQRAMAEVVVGGVAASVVIGLAMSGKITGQGDPDPNKQRTKLAAGEQPYSFQGADGKWYEYSRLQPLGTLIGLAADFSKIYDAFADPEQRDKVLKMIGAAFASAITNQTMLMGLSNIMRAISEPDRYAERYIEGVVSMPVPGALSQAAQLNDPYIREIHGIMDAVKNKIPGEAGRESLQPKIDIWGDPTENRERVAGAGPVRILEPSTDKVKTEAARLGVSVPKNAEDIIMPGSKDRKIGKVELTPEQITAHATVAGKTAYGIMQTLVESKGWDDLPAMAKRAAYEKAFAAGRKQARALVLTPEQRQDEAARIRQEITRQLETAK